MQLFSLIEEHTLTFVASLPPSRASLLSGEPLAAADVTVERADAFYHEAYNVPGAAHTQQSPYEFGAGICPLGELGETGTIDGGQVSALRTADGSERRLPCRLKFCWFSRRNDEPMLDESEDALRFYGTELQKVDLAFELGKEARARKRLAPGTERDRWLDAVHRWKYPNVPFS